MERERERKQTSRCSRQTDRRIYFKKKGQQQWWRPRERERGTDDDDRHHHRRRRRRHLERTRIEKKKKKAFPLSFLPSTVRTMQFTPHVGVCISFLPIEVRPYFASRWFYCYLSFCSVHFRVIF